MPKSIIKSKAVNFESISLEELVAPNKPVIQSSNIRQAEEEEEQGSSTKNRPIIRSSDVRVKSEGIEICLYDFDAESPLPPLPKKRSLRTSRKKRNY